MKLFNSNNKKHNEYIVMIYRILLLMVIYSALRLFFWWFNKGYFPNTDPASLPKMFRGGLKFDISALMMLNLVYLLFYTLPLPPKWKFSKAYQKGLKTIFVTLNTMGIAAACTDLIYFRFIHRRTTYNILESLKNEENMGRLWVQFFFDYWYVFLLFFAIIAFMVYAYSAIKPKAPQYKKNIFYYIQSTVVLALIGGLSIVAIRGGYRHSTRPINMSNAGKYTNNPEEMVIVLNSPFSILRNWGKSNYTDYKFYPDKKALEAAYSPIHHGTKENNQKNVVIFILESFNREYLGAFNKDLDNGQYKGYTPFLDSLVQHSLMFPNAYANGCKSIEAMPSVIASIPSLVLPYISSDHAANSINSLASVLGKEGYQTAYFHGAQNGSMGFQSFSKIAGFNQYFGRTEYNNDKDYDGIWGIWDEPFFQYYCREMSKMEKPFYTTLFSLSSHHPFKVPEKYEGVFPKGNLPVHQCVGYTDNALREFFKAASKTDWYKNTLFVLTADHSSSSVHPEYKTSINRFAIPIIFYSPSDTTLVGVDSTLAEQIDIMPTVLDYVGTKQDYVAFGQDLLKENKRKYIINYTNDTYQFMSNDTVAYFDGQKLISVYNFKKDPHLKQNLVESYDNEEAYSLLKAIVQQYNSRMIENDLTIK